MKNYGRSSVSEFLDDMVVYRKLTPMEPRLPSLTEVREVLELPEDVVPRKSHPDYARVLAFLLRRASSLRGADTSIERLVYVGDTEMNDLTAFENICRAGNWPGMAFIAADRDEPPYMEVTEQESRTLCLANRWSSIGDFRQVCRENGFSIDEYTAVVVDLDKTVLGARGRNDHMIDGARVEAVCRTVGELMGDAFDQVSFAEAYDQLNQPEFHPFTSDNQDYLAHICLVLASGLFSLDALLSDIGDGRMACFDGFVAAVEAQSWALSPEVRDIHASVHRRVQQKDPTPFKAFRFNEYRCTIERLGSLDDDADVADLLAGEIVITQEVREAALDWKANGALLFGLSDKPDEASIPSSDQTALGYQSIHRAETHSVGA